MEVGYILAFNDGESGVVLSGREDRAVGTHCSRN